MRIGKYSAQEIFDIAESNSCDYSNYRHIIYTISKNILYHFKDILYTYDYNISTLTVSGILPYCSASVRKYIREMDNVVEFGDEEKIYNYVQSMASVINNYAQAIDVIRLSVNKNIDEELQIEKFNKVKKWLFDNLTLYEVVLLDKYFDGYIGNYFNSASKTFAGLLIWLKCNMMSAVESCLNRKTQDSGQMKITNTGIFICK